MFRHQVTLLQASERLPGPGRAHFAEVFRRGTLKVEMYAPRGHDPQTPHAQDGLSVIVQGNGIFFCDGERCPFGPGDVLFAATGTEHRFGAFSDDLTVWVVFYGPDGGEQVQKRVMLGAAGPP